MANFAQNLLNSPARQISLLVNPQEDDDSMWIFLALLSSLFAALTSIFAKIGITGVDSTLATALRTIVVLAMAWGMVFITGSHTDISTISRKSWIFLILSGLATGASWLCYFAALQMGQTTGVVAIDKLSVIITIILAVIFLHEEFTIKTAIGSILIGAGTLLMVL
ncbi:EamA family transporter [Alloscardovia criceti]|uniref:EamA family transporter n=1 Tax=Alloscardovia criceti TaxID=356828 RepID=UPI0003762B80|nr:EamA family transporter [Alloscardovia criceti]